MNEQLSWQETIQSHFMDHFGNYRLGVSNGMTPQKLLHMRKLPYDNKTAEGRELINRARIELNAFTVRCTGQGYIAGSIGREPTTYFIAESKSEIRHILRRSSANLGGRINMFLTRGEGVLELEDQNRIKKTMRLLGKYSDEENPVEIKKIKKIKKAS
jgi:hypothetical protein